jgi:hypothetical protein
VVPAWGGGRRQQHPGYETTRSFSVPPRRDSCTGLGRPRRPPWPHLPYPWLVLPRVPRPWSASWSLGGGEDEIHRDSKARWFVVGAGWLAKWMAEAAATRLDREGEKKGFTVEETIGQCPWPAGCFGLLGDFIVSQGVKCKISD